MSPRPSLVPDPDPITPTEITPTSATAHPINQSNQNSCKNEPGRRAGACRVCLKSFKPDDFSKTCFECQQRVCEDCASYSKLDEHEDAVRYPKSNFILKKTNFFVCILFKEYLEMQCLS